MIIEKIAIEKFRGFQQVDFQLGELLTVIAGQNGTQKTTILGLLSQPFTITDSVMKQEKPLCGGSYKSSFSEKFKLSDEFDKPKEHEWSLYLKDDPVPFTLESIQRAGKNSGVRFWRKGNRTKGSGYIQLPVIFLSLKRLLPIGEDTGIQESKDIQLDQEELEFFILWHRKILISHEEISHAKYLESSHKNTLGINTLYYDWKQNSAGQDNVGKILLAILSFKRLKSRYPNDYKGGILAIDELDATLYPGSQVKLINFLRTFASKLNIQIIFTTHSLSILEKSCELQEELNQKQATKNQVKVIFLQKQNQNVVGISDVSYSTIIHRLNVTINDQKPYRVDAFTEDKEAETFVKCLLKSKASKLRFIDCTIGCNSLVELGMRNIPSFTFPNSIVFLDGDVKSQHETMKKIKRMQNYILLPGNQSPERLLADFLFGLQDDSPIWNSINPNFTKQYCFRDYTLADIESDRGKAKLWFNSHLKVWGKNASKIINPWVKNNMPLVEDFINKFEESYNNLASEFGIPQI